MHKPYCQVSKLSVTWSSSGEKMFVYKKEIEISKPIISVMAFEGEFVVFKIPRIDCIMCNY